MNRLIAACVVCLLAMPTLAKESSHPQARALRDALAEMNRQTVDAFVVVEVADSEQYFQYRGLNETHYLFDLPLLALPENALARAVAHFEAQGVPLLGFDGRPPPPGTDRSVQSFQRVLTHQQLDQGVRLGLDYLDAVLNEGQAELRIVKGWQ